MQRTGLRQPVETLRQDHCHGTWYSQRFQRTHVNTACKLLLLEYAFDKVGCGHNRVIARSLAGVRTGIEFAG
jgi:RimJ/RimL family protein N-acetyltransferase